jgi:hypothetical protein
MHFGGFSQNDYLKAVQIGNALREKTKGMQPDQRKAFTAQFMKDATTQGFLTTTGLNFYDLRPPVFNIFPVYTPIRNTTPRTPKFNAGSGTAAHWKAILSPNATNTFIGLSEGNRNAFRSVTEKDFTATYASLGLDSYATFESQSASEGFTDVLGDDAETLLLAYFLAEEGTLLGGNTSLQLGTANTPVATLQTGTVSTIPTATNVSARVVALTWRAATSPSNTVTNGLTTQYVRTNADGTTDTINGGTSIVSASSNVVVTSGSSNTCTATFKATPTRGAFAYAWFVDIIDASAPTTANAKLTFITNNPNFVYTGQAQGTQTAAYAPASLQGFSVDLSTNSLDMDGMLYFAANATYSNGFPITAPWVDAGAGGLTQGTILGSISQFDTILQTFQQVQSAPTAIYYSADQTAAISQALLTGSSASPVANFLINVNESNDFSIKSAPKQYFNRFAPNGGDAIPLIFHPQLPSGTILFDTAKLPAPYGASRMGTTREVMCRRELYGLLYPITSRKWTRGVYSEIVLASRTPHLYGFITGLGAYGATAIGA